MKVPWKIMKTKQKAKTSKHIVNGCEVQIITSVAMVNMCPKNIGITSHRKEDHRPRIAIKI